MVLVVVAKLLGLGRIAKEEGERRETAQRCHSETEPLQRKGMDEAQAAYMSSREGANVLGCGICAASC